MNFDYIETCRPNICPIGLFTPKQNTDLVIAPFRMHNKVISSILSGTCIGVAKERTSYLVTHSNTHPPPYFEGHSLFIEPVSRSQSEDVTIVRFRRNSDALVLTGSRLRDLIEIFAFLHKNNITFRTPKTQARGGI